MSGTKAGGLKAAKTNKKRYGKDFYKNNGAKGGKATGLKGFALNRELARTAGKKGGAMSKRSSVIVNAKKVMRILKLHEKGLNAVQISEKVGMGQQAVRYHIRKYNDFNTFLEKYNG